MKRRTVQNVIFAATVFIVASVILGRYIWQQENRPKILEVYVFALKSGRSVFVRTPNDRRYLIDGGSNSDVIRELTSILPFYSHRIDAVIATNTEGKNVAGLVDVLKRYDVGKVYLSAMTVLSLGLASSTDGIYETFIGQAEASGLEVSHMYMGQTIEMDMDVDAHILFPVSYEQSMATTTKFIYSKASAPEVLFSLRYGDTAIDLFGNASTKVQKYVAAQSATSSKGYNVLVVSHSALPANMSIKLVEKFRPDYLVYSRSPSSGAAKTVKVSGVKAPKKPVIDPLAQIGSDRRFNLKEVGTVHIISDGKETVTVNGE